MKPEKIIVTPKIEVPRPVVGEFMAGGGAVIYRILGVTVLRQAGATARRYRLRCVAIARDELPIGATVHPWRLTPGRQAPPEASRAAMASPLLQSMGVHDRDMLDRLRVKAPVLLNMGLEPIRRARREAENVQRIRMARVGRDRGVVDRADFGPGLRMAAVRAVDGTVLRQPDVMVGDEIEDDSGSGTKGRIVRRARRADPLLTLLKYETITRQQYDAAERLRADMEAATPGAGAAARSFVHLAPWARAGVTKRQIEACASLRGAMAGVAPRDKMALLWGVGGGTIGGLALAARISREKATQSLCRGLDALVTFYNTDQEIAV